jgi:methoxymalonate biosynthesis protein
VARSLRLLKLVIWDLDETLLTGILEEGDEEISPLANELMGQLERRGVLQALATQNPPEVLPLLLDKFNWQKLLVQAEADLGPKARKVESILEQLDIHPLDAAFLDEDPFERGALSAQIVDLTTWSMAELAAYLDAGPAPLTEEARRRPAMYRQQQARRQDEQAASSYTAFLRSCQFQITVRAYRPADALRVRELLTRTHRMNLGVLPVEEALARLHQPGRHEVVVAELKDVYGDMGRCGLVHLTPVGASEVLIESLAISCRTRARGLSLAMLVALLRQGGGPYRTYRCRYRFNGHNRPLRLLLLSAGFKPRPGSEELVLSAEQLAQVELPDWILIEGQAACQTTVKGS